MVLRARTEESREIALSQGLARGLEAGCEAVLMVKAKAHVVFKHMWQVGEHGSIQSAALRTRDGLCSMYLHPSIGPPAHG